MFFRFQDYEVDLYLRQKWQDARLKHPDITESLDLNDPNLVKAIWKPEVYFPNAKHAEFQFVTVPNVLIRIKPDGDILYMLRYSKINFLVGNDVRNECSSAGNRMEMLGDRKLKSYDAFNLKLRFNIIGK